ncbi:MAG: DNA alkylation repair protein [Candidatus Aminicenantes bacterium]|nr:DNA alkylation repair protein [Candidatus Aminicenantes bacterium]
MTKNGPSPREVAREALKRLRTLADPVRAMGAERYFKETVKCFGVGAPEIHALAAELYGLIKGNWTAGQAVELCDILFPSPWLEAKAVGALILDRFDKELGPGFFAKAKGWLAGDLLDNWASVDGFCTQTMGAFLERRPAFVERIKAWAFHRNRWVKRASLVSFIKPAKKTEFLPAIYEISESVFPVDDDLIHKANGWLLREAGKTDPARLERFLLAHGPAIPRTTLRYAIERFPETKRKTLLRDTRPK